MSFNKSLISFQISLNNKIMNKMYSIKFKSLDLFLVWMSVLLGESWFPISSFVWARQLSIFCWFQGVLWCWPWFIGIFYLCSYIPLYPQDMWFWTFWDFVLFRTLTSGWVASLLPEALLCPKSWFSLICGFTRDIYSNLFFPSQSIQMISSSSYLFPKYSDSNFSNF